MLFTILWFAAALAGLGAILLGVRVITDDAWDNGDWWGTQLLNGLLFSFLFPVVRTTHTRDDEVTNAWIVVAVGTVWLVLGGALLIYEYTSG